MPFYQTAFFLPMKIKWLLLFILIGMPVCVYLFLQTFGENQFDIPVYFEDGIEEVYGNCEPSEPSAQFNAKKFFEVDAVQADFESDNIIVYDLGSLHSGGISVRNNLLTFLNKFQGYEDLKFIAISNSDEEVGSLSTFDHVLLYQSEVERILNYGRCQLQVNIEYDSAVNNFSNSQLVLVDRERRIRGYYDPTSLKEIDRLNTELYILLSL